MRKGLVKFLVGGNFFIVGSDLTIAVAMHNWTHLASAGLFLAFGMYWMSKLEVKEENETQS